MLYKLQMWKMANPPSPEELERGRIEAEKQIEKERKNGNFKLGIPPAKKTKKEKEELEYMRSHG